MYGAPFRQRADITLSSTYPIDFDLFQADRGLFSAAIPTNTGGEIVLLSPCYEGVSPAHPEAVEWARLDDDALWRLAQTEDGHDPLSVAEALYFNSIKEPFTITLIAEGIGREVATQMGFNYLEPAELADYVKYRLNAAAILNMTVFEPTCWETAPPCAVKIARCSHL